MDRRCYPKTAGVSWDRPGSSLSLSEIFLLRPVFTSLAQGIGFLCPVHRDGGCGYRPALEVENSFSWKRVTRQGHSQALGRLCKKWKMGYIRAEGSWLRAGWPLASVSVFDAPLATCPVALANFTWSEVQLSDCIAFQPKVLTSPLTTFFFKAELPQWLLKLYFLSLPTS